MEKANYTWVRVLGYAAIAIAVFDYIMTRTDIFLGKPYVFNPGLNLAICAIALVGVVALVVAQCLKSLERRLSLIENNQRKN